jgi:hypothetical protein
MSISGNHDAKNPVDDWPSRIRQAHRNLVERRFRSIELLVPQGSSERLTPKVVLAGSFDPLHHGHCQMAAVAAKSTGQSVHFELSIDNAEKPPLDPSTAVARLLPGMPRERDGQASIPEFAPHGVLLSDLADFASKSTAYPQALFAVGVDTWIRVADPVFYDAGKRNLAIDRIAGNGCRFLVFGRFIDGQFMELDDLVAGKDFPQSLIDISSSIPESVFRADVSSTALRRPET